MNETDHSILKEEKKKKEGGHFVLHLKEKWNKWSVIHKLAGRRKLGIASKF